ncbi:MAG: ABC transporter permease [Chloroflexota bacterium]
MVAFTLRRLVAVVPVMFLVAIVAFLLIHLVPGNPALVILGEGATPGQVAQLTHALRLDEPLWQQFSTWLLHALRGDLGQSISYQQPVAQVVITHLGPTIWEAVLATALSVALAIPTGILAAWRSGSVLDRLFASISLIGVSIPAFWLGLMLVIAFSIELRLLPVQGYVPLSRGLWPWLSHLILPVVVLALGQTALIARMLRDGLLDHLRRPYVRTARAKGGSEADVLIGHATPNALIPTVTVVGASLATLLGGAVVVETVFDIPGVGNLIVQAITNRDYPLVEGVAFVVALIYVVVNLGVDLLYAVIDPRIRYG